MKNDNRPPKRDVTTAAHQLGLRTATETMAMRQKYPEPVIGDDFCVRWQEKGRE